MSKLVCARLLNRVRFSATITPFELKCIGLLASTDADMVDQLTRIVRDTELRSVISKHNRDTPSPVDWSEVVARNVAAYRVAIEMRAGTPGLPGFPG